MTEPPNFLIIGAYRAGTTSLRRLLTQHPDVFMPSLAEPSFFAFGPGGEYPPLLLKPDADPYRRKRTINLEDYLALFDGVSGQLAVGEDSPEYLRASGSAERIRAFNPDMKLVVTLRDPVERVISDFGMHRRDGVESCDNLGDALDLERERAEVGVVGCHYLETSRYGQQLNEVFAVFPRHQVHVMISERWQADRTAHLVELCRFLGVDPGFEFDDRVARNRSGEPVNATAAALFRARILAQPYVGHLIPERVKAVADRWSAQALTSVVVGDETRARISEELAPDQRLLESLIGRVPGWRHHPA